MLVLADSVVWARDWLRGEMASEGGDILRCGMMRGGNLRGIKVIVVIGMV